MIRIAKCPGSTGGRRRRRRSHRLRAATAAFWLITTSSAAADDYWYERPFHPLLCDGAVAAAQNLEHGRADGCDLSLLADGLYCRGLQGDLEALDASIILLERVAHRDSLDVFTQLELAGALHRRGLASSRVSASLERALTQLRTVDVGRAHAELLARTSRNLALVRSTAPRMDASGGTPRAVSEVAQRQAGVAAVSRLAPCAAAQLTTVGGGT